MYKKTIFIGMVTLLTLLTGCSTRKYTFTENDMVKYEDENVVFQEDTRNEGLSDIGREQIKAIKKKPITKEEEEFVKRIGEDTRDIAKESDNYASVLIAMAITESNFGKSVLVKENNNYFNQLDGTKKYNAKLKEEDFKKFDTYKESLYDLVIYLNRVELFENSKKSNASTYKDATKEISQYYSTQGDFKYILNTYIEKYDLTRYDK